ncbi:PREDICTED: putative serine protease K12H4.7 [Acromyrmex echinatior]|uniref:Putative serine protease K12H4.7 n=1 Tax=Acromyrmex echinatior TaxID=103372 RepID=F4WG05_ACREC|nr:PREDICTED: putative serine protease K12H4.7 [Acromyrmex echinatior]EGI66772.1 Putative serine protease K12H4.7 [Acromyrmex echinatior]
MIALKILFVLCSVHPLVNGVGFRGFTFKGLEEPESLTKNVGTNIVESWITQPLDHFNHRDNRTWSMRYKENSAFLKKNGPILIMIGGEWEITNGFLQGGLMYELGVKYHGLMYYTEHRFYGQSRPTKDISTENLQYLNADQALADLAYFIDTKKKEKNLEKSIVIVVGGSYAGNMAAWARLKYPHLIQGALASSAPVRAKADFYEYYEVVTDALGKYSKTCIESVKTAFASVEELLAMRAGPQKLKLLFKLCHVPDVRSSSDLGYFMNTLSEIFAGVVQYNKIENSETGIAALCNKMTAKHLGSPLQRLARIFSNQKKCNDVNYNNFLKTYREISWDSPAATSIMRQWYHQTCTEYGYYQTTNSNKSIFGKLFPLNYFINLCTDLYGDYHNKKILDSHVRRTNIMYGGKLPDLRNVIFTNGNSDPWHPLSVLQDLNAFSPAIVINGSSHCRDLYSDVTTDPDNLKAARAKIRKIIGKWISS